MTTKRGDHDFQVFKQIIFILYPDSHCIGIDTILFYRSINAELEYIHVLMSTYKKSTFHATTLILILSFHTIINFGSLPVA